MSVQAIAWVLEQHPSKGAQRLVMIALANHAGAHPWECWPSVETIAREANLTGKHVRRCLAELEAEGWVVRVVNQAPDTRIPGNRRPNLYRIVSSSPSASAADQGGTSEPSHSEGAHAEQGGTSEPARGDIDGRQGGRGSTTKPSVEPSCEPSDLSRGEQSSLELVGEVAPPAVDPFDAFYSAYPRHVAKDAARKAFAKVLERGVDPAEVIAGAERYAQQRSGQEPRFTAHPATWLNQGRWMDEAPATGPVMSQGAHSAARWLAATGSS